MTDRPMRSVANWIVRNPAWVALATFATLLALAVFFVDLAYRSQIDDLRRKADDSAAETASLTRANRELRQRLTGVTRPSESSGREGVSTDVDRPYDATELHLVIGHTVSFWDGQCRLTLRNTYQSIGNASVDGYLGDEPVRWDLYASTRTSFSFHGVLYYADLSNLGFDSAVLTINPKKLP